MLSPDLLTEPASSLEPTAPYVWVTPFTDGVLLKRADARAGNLVQAGLPVTQLHDEMARLDGAHSSNMVITLMGVGLGSGLMVFGMLARVVPARWGAAHLSALVPWLSWTGIAIGVVAIVIGVVRALRIPRAGTLEPRLTLCRCDTGGDVVDRIAWYAAAHGAYTRGGVMLSGAHADLLWRLGERVEQLRDAKRIQPRLTPGLPPEDPASPARELFHDAVAELGTPPAMDADAASLWRSLDLQMSLCWNPGCPGWRRDHLRLVQR